MRLQNMLQEEITRYPFLHYMLLFISLLSSQVNPKADMGISEKAAKSCAIEARGRYADKVSV